jgi:hypothetical protein
MRRRPHRGGTCEASGWGSDSLEHSGIHAHMEAGGHELANKVFIEEVIAKREKPAV